MKRNINIFAQQSVGKAFAVGPEIPLKNIKNTFRLTHMKKSFISPVGRRCHDYRL